MLENKTIRRIPGLVLTEHAFLLPLDHTNPTGEKISIFAREVVSPAKEHQPDLPWLIYFQGGPGFPAGRPLANTGWLSPALKNYRVLLLDQRGTGRSTPANFQSLARRGSPQNQADYLKHFRADSIVKDAEMIRKIFINETPWSVLGQSYGGFCAATYLSFAPEGLREAIITGGIPSIGFSIDDIYRASYKRCRKKNQRYYQQYPEDVHTVSEIVTYLKNNPTFLPSGIRLSPEHFLQIGLAFGTQRGFETVHYLLAEAFIEGSKGRELNYAFLRGIENSLSFDVNPLYALLHESIYCEKNASAWSAARVLAEFPEFDLEHSSPYFFRGEMVYPWLFEQCPALQPLKPVADLLAAFKDWPPLYDLSILRRNVVPCAAIVYYEDMYVDAEFSQTVAENIKGLKLWITNEYEHDGIRTDGESIFNRLKCLLAEK